MVKHLLIGNSYLDKRNLGSFLIFLIFESRTISIETATPSWSFIITRSEETLTSIAHNLVVVTISRFFHQLKSIYNAIVIPFELT